MLVSELLAGLVAKLAGLGLATKAAMGLGIAAAATTTAGVAGVLPDAAQHALATVVEAVSPFDLPEGNTETSGTTDVDVSIPGSTTVVSQPDEPGDGGTDDVTGAGQPANHGACVSAVAHDKTASGREHGAAVSAAARSDCGKTPASSATSTSTTSTSTTTTTVDDTISASSDRGKGSNNSGNGNGNGGNGGNPGSNGNRGSGRN